MSSSLNLSERLREKTAENTAALEEHRSEVEKVAKEQITALTGELKRHVQLSANACKNELNSIASGIQEVSNVAQKRTALWSGMALVFAFLTVLIGFVLGWGMLNWQSYGIESLKVEKEGLRKEIEGLKTARKQLTLWGLTPHVTDKGRYLILKKGMEWDGGLWTINGNNAVRIGG